MDAFLLAARDLADILIPIVLFLLIVFFIYLLITVIKFIKQLANSLRDLDKTVFKINESLDKVQAPLNTVEDLSHTVDNIHHQSIEAFKKAGVYAKENVQIFSDYIKMKREKAKEALNNDNAGQGQQPSVEEPKSDE